MIGVLNWIAIDWHWAMILIALTLLAVFGWVVVVVEDDGDWWVL